MVLTQILVTAEHRLFIVTQIWSQQRTEERSRYIWITAEDRREDCNTNKNEQKEESFWL